MTKAEMRQYTRWLISSLGAQWIPETSSSQFDLGDALAMGIRRYCEEMECYRAQYSLKTLAQISGTGSGSANSTTLTVIGCSVASGTITAGMLVQIVGDNTVYTVAANATITGSSASATVAPALVAAATSQSVKFSDSGVYSFHSFSSTNDVTGGSGTVYGDRILKVIGMTYDGNPLGRFDETSRDEKTRLAGITHSYEENYDWHTIKLRPPPNASKLLVADANVVLDTTVSGIFANDADSWPANTLDQDIPCLWAAKQVLMFSPSEENRWRIAKLEEDWAQRMAAARGRLKKRNTPIHLHRHYDSEYGRPIFPDGVTISQGGVEVEI